MIRSLYDNYQTIYIYSFYQNGGLDITTALIYDAVQLFARAIHEYDTFIQVISFKKNVISFHMRLICEIIYIDMYLFIYLLIFNKNLNHEGC